MSPNGRVCDRCIRKKVKCNLQRPHCSRCSEAGYPCTYSKEKGKPGPRGARPRNRLTPNARLNSASLSSHHTQTNHDGSSASESIQSHSPVGSHLLNEGVPMQQFTPEFSDLSLNFEPSPFIMKPVADHFMYPGYYLTATQERDILLRFFDDIHSAIPLFRRSKFLKSYDEGTACRDLVVTMVTVAAKILGPISFWQAEDVHLCMESLLAATEFGQNTPDFQVDLAQFRRECLLAYYTFHQIPGPPAWMRISRLTRRAYAMGLNQLEVNDMCSAYGSRLMAEDEIEDWRYAWWCVYCLDSYSNISFSAPFLVELESINTALVRRTLDDGEVPNLPKIFLPDSVDDLWRTAQKVISSPCEREFNIHIITTTILRQAGIVLRLRCTQKRVRDKTISLKNTLASLRLALPPGYLNPTRNALASESSAHHHTRLTNLLHLHMTRLLISLPHDFKDNEEEWMNGWQQSLESCQDIALIVEQWNNQFSSRVDPAICLIIFMTIWVTNLQRRCIADSASPLLSHLAQAENMMLLFLEQFSRIWALPHILIQLFRNSSADDLLVYADVDQILSQLKMPLHPKTFHRASTFSFGAVDGPEDVDTVNLTDIWSPCTQGLSV